jgi:putative tryptophan/tyrosine transport system substrate-binding protein
MQFGQLRRREFVAVLGGAAAWPLAARGQQRIGMRRIAMLNSVDETDLAAQGQAAAFRKRLDELGWTDGRNIQIDYRWGNGSIDRMRAIAQELAQLNPDVIVSATTPATAALQAATRTIPIVFVKLLCRGRRIDVLWNRFGRFVSRGRGLRGSHLARC